MSSTALTTPTHHQRQLMQQLEGRDWVNAIGLPEARKTMKYLLEKRWIECQGTGRGLSYRLTHEGLLAKRARIISVSNGRKQSADGKGEVVRP
jgi:hypothetical protein